MALIDDPDLLDQILRELRVKGQINPFDISEVAVPVFDIGRLAGLDPTVVTTTAGQQGIRGGTADGNTGLVSVAPTIVAADVADGGVTINPAAGTVLADSGQITGLRQALVQFGSNQQTDFRIEWRNAANAANIASWTVLIGGASANALQWGPFRIDFATNERLRVVNVSAITGSLSAVVSVPIAATSVAV